MESTEESICPSVPARDLGSSVCAGTCQSAAESEPLGCPW